MKPLYVSINKHFIGREHEQKQLQDIAAYSEAAIVILYGRRRVGKTELIEQTYATRNLIKLEGIEGRNEVEQRQHVLLQLSLMTQDISYAKLHVTTWTEIFELLSRLVKTGVWTLYFEEVQWLANYKPAFISEYGAPSYGQRMSYAQAQEAQAGYHRGNWLDILYNSAGYAEGMGNAVGGVTFEWLDEWWKNYEPAVHDTKADVVGPFAGGYYFEEWFGIFGQGEGKSSPYLREPRKIYYTYKELWNR